MRRAMKGAWRGAATSLLLIFLAACASGPSADPHLPHPGAPATEQALEPPATDWALYDQEGRELALQELLEAVVDVEVLFIGERHGDPAGHDFQLQLLQALAGDDLPSALDDRGLILSLEMFERDVQPVLDEYLAGLITEEHFLSAARPWDSYRRDYRPLVEVARQEGLPVVAANAPRRYVNRVSRLGRDALAELGEDALKHLPPLPYPGPTDEYRTEWNALMDGIPGNHGAQGGDTLLEAQSLWDASMAYSLAEVLESADGDPLVVHVTGSFHVDHGTGTPEALAHYRPGTTFAIVSIRASEDLASSPEAQDRARGDFVVLTSGAAPGS
jgi:uncharacterized iron-regulated protein